MKLYLDIKPRVMFITSFTSTSLFQPVGSTQNKLKDKLLKGYYFKADCWYNTYDSQSNTRTVVRAYSLEKRRKKVKIRTIKGKQVRQVISPSYWIAIYYDIPTEYLRLAGLRVVQGNRTWKFESTK